MPRMLLSVSGSRFSEAACCIHGVFCEDKIVTQVAVDGEPSNQRKGFRQGLSNLSGAAVLGVDDEEQLKIEEDKRNHGKVQFAIWASFVLNFALFLIQLYAAISTGSLAVRTKKPPLKAVPH